MFILIAGSFAGAFALNEALKPLEQAIILAKRQEVIDGLKKVGPLKPEDKNELLALAQKWERLRKTVMTPADKVNLAVGAGFFGFAAVPWAAMALFPFIRWWVQEVLPTPAIFAICGSFSLYCLAAGFVPFKMGWNVGGTLVIEQEARAVTKLIKAAPLIAPSTVDQKDKKS